MCTRALAIDIPHPISHCRVLGIWRQLLHARRPSLTHIAHLSYGRAKILEDIRGSSYLPQYQTTILQKKAIYVGTSVQCPGPYLMLIPSSSQQVETSHSTRPGGGTKRGSNFINGIFVRFGFYGTCVENTGSNFLLRVESWDVIRLRQ